MIPAHDPQGSHRSMGLDCLQLATVQNPRDPRAQQVATTSRALMSVAKPLNCPVIGVCQLNDEAKARESRGTASIANCILKTWEKTEGKVIVPAVKGRNIPKSSYFFEFKREYRSSRLIRKRSKGRVKGPQLGEGDEYSHVGIKKHEEVFSEPSFPLSLHVRNPPFICVNLRNPR